MSQHAPQLHSLEGIENPKIALVVGEFNEQYTTALADINTEFLREHRYTDITRFVVPGAFEIPGFVGRLLETEKYDLIIALGVLVRGATPHFDYISAESARGLMDLSLAYDTPIINGILTCNTEEQVEERITPVYAVSGLNLLSEIAKI